MTPAKAKNSPGAMKTLYGLEPMGEGKKEMPLTPKSVVGATEESIGAPLSDEVRRAFCEYIHPMLPVLPSSTLRDAFVVNDTNQFLRVLRLAITAAAAPYLVTQQRSHDGRHKHQDFIDGHYNTAVASQQEAFFKNTSCLTQLETIQVAIFLSFAARRRLGTPTASSLEWLQLIISRLKTAYNTEQPALDSGPAQGRHWRRIWWTCFLYERLDAFNSTDEDPSATSQLKCENMPPLTLDDMDVTSWRCTASEDHEICDVRSCDALKTLRAASIFVHKVHLAREIDVAMTQSRDRDTSAQDGDHGHPALLGTRFWHAHAVESSFATWQYETGNADSLYTSSSACAEDASLLVHYTSLCLLYYRVVIALYTSSANNSEILSSASRRMQRSLEKDRVLRLYAMILGKVGVLVKQGQLREAHITYPNMRWYLLTATGIWWRERQHPERERMRSFATSLVKALEKVVVGSGKIPVHDTAKTPELFRFPTPPATPSSVDSRNGITDGDVEELERLGRAVPRCNGSEESSMEAEDMLQNMEALLYNFGRDQEPV